MHGNLPPGARVTITRTVQTDSETNSTVQADSEDHKWFSEPARGLLGKDGGLHLRLVTGLEPHTESSCYRYVRGQRGVTGWIIYLLLRSPQGKAWLDSFCKGVPWYEEEQAELRRARRILQAIDSDED